MKIDDVFTYLCVPDGQAAIDFYGAAFGARETLRLVEPGGRVGHAEPQFGATTVMLCEEYPELGVRAPAPDGTASVSIHLHVDDADVMIDAAVRAGATLEREPRDEFYGERSGVIRDPAGHRWVIGHRIEAVAPEEMQRRYAARFPTSADQPG
jgi:PhnB protein